MAGLAVEIVPQKLVLIRRKKLLKFPQNFVTLLLKYFFCHNFCVNFFQNKKLTQISWHFFQNEKVDTGLN